MTSLLPLFLLAPANVPVVSQLKVLPEFHPVAYAAAPTGHKFVACMEDRSVRVIDAATRMTVLSLSGHPQPAYAAAWSPDGKLIATGDESGRVWVWSATSGKKLREYRVHTRGVQKLSFNRTGKYLISTGKDDSVDLYDLGNKKDKEKVKILGGGASLYGAEFSPKTDAILTASLAETIRLYLPTGTPVTQMNAHGGLGALDVDFSPNGAEAASAGRDDIVCLWDVAKRTRIGSLHGHSDWVNYVRFSPNGRYLASSSVDHTVRVWDSHSGVCTATLQDECAVGSPLCWTADGKFLITVNISDQMQVNSVVPAQSGKSSSVGKRSTSKRHSAKKRRR